VSDELEAMGPDHPLRPALEHYRTQRDRAQAIVENPGSADRRRNVAAWRALARAHGNMVAALEQAYLQYRSDASAAAGLLVAGEKRS
jgi:hypothetical protein